MRKYLFLFIIFILVNACAIKLANLNEIQVVSENKDWKVRTQNLDYLKIYFYSEKLPNMEIFMDDINVKDEQINLFLPIPIPYKTTYNIKNNCTTTSSIGFYTRNIKNGKVIEFLKNNILVFNTNKTFIIKDNKQYKIDGGNNNTILNISEILLNNFDKEKFKDRDVYYSRLLVSPIGCQALEGTTLIIGGISLNGKELPPIEIKLSYKKNKK